MSFTAKITADITRFEQNIDKAIGSTNRLEKTVSQKLSKIGDSFVNIGAKASILSTAIVGATVGLVKMGISAGDASAEINNLSTATSLSPDVIQELSYVANASNSSFEGLRSSMDSFQRRLKTVGEEGSRVNEMFGRLGVSTTDASGNVRGMDDVLLDTFNRLGDMEDGLAKNAIGTELFGRSWNEVALIVSSGSKGIAELREEAHELGLVLDKNTLQSSDDFATAMGLVGFQIDTLKTKIGASLVPILQESLLPLLEDKIIPAVSRFADSIAELSEKFNALSPSTKNAIFAITGITVAIGPLLLALGGILKMLPLITAGFTALTGPIGLVVAAITAATALIITHWDELKKTSKVATDSIVGDWNYMADHLKTVSASIGKVVRGDFAGWWEDVRTTFDNNIEYLRKKWEGLQKILGIWKGDSKAANAGMMAGALGGIEEAADNTTASVDNLTTSFKELGEAQEAAAAKIAPDDVTGVSVLAPVIEPTIDAQGLKEKLRDTTYGALADLGEGIKVITIDLSSMLSGALTDVFGSVADAMMNGDNMMAALGASLLGTLGGIMVQLGQMVIVTGKAIEAVKAALSNLGGIGAIAAGVALIAIGSLFRSGAGKLSRSMGSGGGYSSAPSMQNSQPTLGNSDYRGAYRDDFKVEFKIGSNELVGVLDTANQRRNRLG